MRRRGITVLIIAVVAAAFVGVYTAAYRAGESSGRNKVTTDRSQFQTRIAANPQSGAAGGAPGAAGGQPGGAGGSAAAGSGAQRPGGGPGNATGASGTPAAGGSARPGGAGASVAGRVTKVDGAIVSVQQTDNSTVAVTTNGETAIRKLVAGALTDLKTGDIITVDGAKTSDTAYSAKTITSLGQVTGATAAGSGRPNAVPSGVPGPAVTGQIKSMNGGTITVQGFDGATVTVMSSPTTVVRTQQPGTLGDIKTGDLLVVLGEKTGDSAFLARSITNQGASGQ